MQALVRMGLNYPLLLFLWVLSTLVVVNWSWVPCAVCQFLIKAWFLAQRQWIFSFFRSFCLSFHPFSLLHTCLTGINRFFNCLFIKPFRQILDFILKLIFEQFLPHFNITIESRLHNICLLYILVPIADHSWFFLLFKFIQHSLNASVKLLFVFLQ